MLSSIKRKYKKNNFFVEEQDFGSFLWISDKNSDINEVVVEKYVVLLSQLTSSEVILRSLVGESTGKFEDLLMLPVVDDDSLLLATRVP